MILEDAKKKIDDSLDIIKSLRDKIRSNTLSETEQRESFHKIINNLFSASLNVARGTEFFTNLRIHMEDLEKS